MLTIIRKIFFFAARHNINILMHHVPGHFNTNADLLSRLQVPQFLRSNPQADARQTDVPIEAWKIL